MSGVGFCYAARDMRITSAPSQLGFGLLLRCALLLMAGALSACGSSAPSTIGVARSTRQSGINCAPFARELSGVALYGDANDWWSAASGRYRRGKSPEIGAVLVLPRQDRLPAGPVGVVSAGLAARQIHVIQANWEKDMVDQDQLVVDVSERNDWTAIRVWYPPVNQMGSHTYRAYGFIAPPQPVKHEELVRTTPAATRFAMDTTGRPPPRARRYAMAN